MFKQKPKTLYHWYRNHLSDYLPDKESGKWHPKSLEKVDIETGEVTDGKPLYVFKPDNIGERMSIDDKAIGHNGFTIFSNGDTGRIAMMIESCKKDEVSEAIELFGDELKKIKSVSSDMAASYLAVCNETMPQAKVVIDKFHVIQYVYDAVSNVRTRIKKELTMQLTKGKKKTEEDKTILCQLELLKRVRYRLHQSPDKWSDEATEIMNQVFDNHDELKTAYDLAQSFKRWYDIRNRTIHRTQITSNLTHWYSQVKQCAIEEFYPVAKMIRKHESEIINYFINGLTNARAERLNGKINRFVSNNYGIKDKDFLLYRTALYFS